MTAVSTTPAAATDLGPELPDYRVTRERYHRMAESGVFDGERVELIGGKIVPMSPQNPPHYKAIDKTADALEASFGDAWWVRTQGPLSLRPDSEPEPDVAVVVAEWRERDQHPDTALLVVEVADSTLLMDRRQKPGLYAAAVIAEYWILNLRDRRLEVHRQPMADTSHPFGWRYREVRALEATDRVAPLAATHHSITVADLLP